MKILNELQQLLAEDGKRFPPGGLSEYKGITKYEFARIAEDLVDPSRIKVFIYPGTAGITLRFDKGDTSLFIIFFPERGYSSLGALFLTPNMQGNKIARKIFAKMIPVVEHIGATELRAKAAEVGRYAWCKYGFSATDPQVLQERYKQVLRLAPWLKGQYPRSPSHMIEVGVMNTVGTGNKLKVWMKKFFSPSVFSPHFRGKNGEFLIGKYVLMTSRGYEIVNPLHGRHKQILDAYIASGGVQYERVWSMNDKAEARGYLNEANDDDDMLMRMLASQTGGEDFAKTVTVDEADLSSEIQQEMTEAIKRGKI